MVVNPASAIVFVALALLRTSSDISIAGLISPLSACFFNELAQTYSGPVVKVNIVNSLFVWLPRKTFPTSKCVYKTLCPQHIAATYPDTGSMIGRMNSISLFVLHLLKQELSLDSIARLTSRQHSSPDRALAHHEDKVLTACP